MRSKRILSLVLALVMVLGTFGTVFAAPTDNVKVDWLIEEGLVKGYGDGTYGLDKAITRAEVATMVVRALGLEEEATKMMNIPSVFPDMRGTNVAWANGYVNLAVGKGIINGYEDGTFKPAQDISYAEVAAILVRALDGMTPAEIAAATGRDWATTYLVKAAELGVLDDVVILDFNAKAARVTIFEMVYNTIHKGFGNFTIVKGIVLENNRVEKLTNADEVVVEILKEIQTANFANVSRKERGDQVKFAIEAKVGDVEHLLGKVADFTLDKNDKVVKVTVDESYEYWQGPITATKNKVNSFTVELDERYRERDERIFRTYHNDKPLSYEDFYQVVGKDKIKLDFARVTTKNGKVLFIDSFTFDDIAPVQEIRRDGLDVYVYNDYRDARLEKFEPRALVLGFDDGRFSRMDRKDIKTNDVAHVYDKNKMIVRTDAAVNGEYIKVERNSFGEYHAYIDDVGYLINDENYRRPVYAHDSKAFTTMYAMRASQELRDFYKEEVNILIDINDDLQLFGANVEWNEGMAIVKQVLARGQVKFIDASNEELILDEDYSSTISKYNLDSSTTTINQRLNIFDTQDLTFVLGNDTKIDTLVRIATADQMRSGAQKLLSGKAVDMNNSFIRMATGTPSRYQVLDRTNVFAINKAGGISASTVAKYQASLLADSEVKAFVLSDLQVSRLLDNATITDRHRITRQADIAHTIVFVDLALSAGKTDGETIMVDRVYTATNPHYVIGQRPDNFGKDTVQRIAAPGVNLKDMNPDDIVSLKLSQDDDKLIKSFVASRDILISGNKVKTDSWLVVGGENLEYSSSEYRRLFLEDANGNREWRWLTRGVEEFGTVTINSVVTFHQVNNIDKDIDVLRVYPRGTRVTANGDVAPLGGIVTYINITPGYYSFTLDYGTPYFITPTMILKNSVGTILATGNDILVGPNNLVAGDQVKVEGNVITRLNLAADTNAALAVDNMIKVLKIVDPTNPTTAERNAIAAARLAYNGLTNTQKDLVRRLGALEALEAIVVAADAPTPEAAAVKAVKDAVFENDKAKFLVALNNALFTNYVAANGDAYWTARTAISTPATTALMDAELAIVNDAVEVAEVVDAATSGTQTDFNNALNNPKYTAYKAANINVYWVNKASFATLTNVAAVNNLLVYLNDFASIQAAKAALELTVLNPTSPTATIQLPTTGIDGTTIGWAVTGAGTIIANVYTTPARSASAQTEVLTASITKGSVPAETQTFTVTVPAGATGTDDIIVVKN